MPLERPHETAADEDELVRPHHQRPAAYRLLLGLLEIGHVGPQQLLEVGHGMSPPGNSKDFSFRRRIFPNEAAVRSGDLMELIALADLQAMLALNILLVQTHR